MLSRISIQNPVFAWMLMLALILLGAISYKRLGISENPDIDFPVINLAFTLEGASPEIMESDIVDYVEEALIPIEGLIEIRSSSRRGLPMLPSN